MAKINKSNKAILTTAKEKKDNWELKFRLQLSKSQLKVVNMPLKVIRKKWLKAGYTLQQLERIGSLKAISILNLKNW